jgi:hypothetical protein
MHHLDINIYAVPELRQQMDEDCPESIHMQASNRHMRVVQRRCLLDAGCRRLMDAYSVHEQAHIGCLLDGVCCRGGHYKLISISL